MRSWSAAIRDSVFSGAIANLAVSGAAAALGKVESNNAIAPINAVSHVIWGERAGDAGSLSLKYTVPGIVINHVACTFWALIYEKLGGDDRDTYQALLKAGAVSALAYITDYHLVPKRLTPGFELRLSPCSLSGIYVALGLGFALSTKLRR